MKWLFSLFIKVILKLRYKIEIEGESELLTLEKDYLNKQGLLFLPNHPALVDPIIALSIISKRFNPWVMVDQKQLDKPGMGMAKKVLNMLPIPDMIDTPRADKSIIFTALDRISKVLVEKKSALLYPSGYLYRKFKEDVKGASAVSSILEKSNKPIIVLVRITGLWGSRFSFAFTGKYPKFGYLEILSFFGIIFSNLFFFIPKRRVKVEFKICQNFPYDKGKKEINEFLTKYYNERDHANTFVPYYFWQGHRSYTVPEPKVFNYDDYRIDVSPNTKKIVFDYLAQVTQQRNINEDFDLGNNLGMDSLTMAELFTWLEEEFSVRLGNYDNIKRVADVLQVAQGNTFYSSADGNNLKKVPLSWFNEKKDNQRLSIKEGNSLPEIFLNSALDHPNKVLVADQISGSKTYRQIIIAIFVLKPFIEKIDSQRVGVLMPASVGSMILYLAIHFAGKIPIMINWTLGSRNLEHIKKLVNITCILTSQTLVAKLKGTGVDLSPLQDHFLFLEDLKKDIKLVNKLKAVYASLFKIKDLLKVKINDTSVILFTSGSENFPKAVPLSHRNQIENIKGAFNYFPMYQNDRVMGFLPSFHSFGMLMNIVIPISYNMPIAFHANPIEGRALANLIYHYKTTIMAGTPSFINGILRASNKIQQNSMRASIVGAEKCPDDLLQFVHKKFPEIKLLEGYGITECSPVVSLNPHDQNKPGTIGQILTNIEYTLMEVEGTKEAKMLLVRGPSIFAGYINHQGKTPFITYQGKSWYKTGDLVHEDSDHFIHFKGRLKRFVKIGGEMISLPAIETALMSFYEDLENDGPSLAIEVREFQNQRPEIILVTPLDIDRKEANKNIKKSGLSDLHNIREVFHLDQIPQLGTGKTDYRNIRDLLNEKRA